MDDRIDLTLTQNEVALIREALNHYGGTLIDDIRNEEMLFNVKVAKNDDTAKLCVDRIQKWKTLILKLHRLGVKL